MKKMTANRRQFLKTAAVVGAGFWVSPRIGYSESTSPNERLNIGQIGVTNRGKENLGGLTGNKTVNMVALCDVDENNLNSAATNLPKAQKYNDFRKMLEQKDIDAVLVCTPDHMHFHASLMAIQSGRHVYCEKPLTHKVWEARMLTEASVKHKRVTQMGTQIHAGDNYRRVVEAIRSGVIGSVKEVHTLVPPRWGSGSDRPIAKPPVPSTLNYDVWLGPAEPWEYHPTYFGMNWRSWWNFGNGTLGDMACHHMDLPFWALGLKHPTKITPLTGDKPNTTGCPSGCSVRWDFAADGDRKAVSLFWHSGEENLPEDFADWGLPKGWQNGNVFIGEKGILYADYGSHGLRPEKNFVGYKAPEKTIKSSIGHHNEWIEACKSGDVLAPQCNFTYGGLLSEMVLLGCAAYRAQTPLEWDGPGLKVTNTREADKYLRREYRKGWEITL